MLLQQTAYLFRLYHFNTLDVNWYHQHITTNSDYLCDFVINHNTFQQVNKPTFIHGSIPDLVINSDTDLITDLVVHPQYDLTISYNLTIEWLRKLLVNAAAIDKSL